MGVPGLTKMASCLIGDVPNLVPQPYHPPRWDGHTIHTISPPLSPPSDITPRHRALYSLHQHRRHISLTPWCFVVSSLQLSVVSFHPYTLKLCILITITVVIKALYSYHHHLAQTIKTAVVQITVASTFKHPDSEVLPSPVQCPLTRFTQGHLLNHKCVKQINSPTHGLFTFLRCTRSLCSTSDWLMQPNIQCRDTV